MKKLLDFLMFSLSRGMQFLKKLAAGVRGKNIVPVVLIWRLSGQVPENVTPTVIFSKKHAFPSRNIAFFNFWGTF